MPVNIGSNPVKVEIRGFIRGVSEDREFRSSDNRVRSGFFFIKVQVYRINEEEQKGYVKVYITTAQLGMNGQGIIFYPSNDPNDPSKEFQSGISKPSKLMNERIGIRGMISKTDELGYDFFMNKLEKVKIFPDPKVYFKKYEKERAYDLAVPEWKPMEERLAEEEAEANNPFFRVADKIAKNSRIVVSRGGNIRKLQY